jgi:hypothetical protein
MNNQTDNSEPAGDFALHEAAVPYQAVAPEEFYPLRTKEDRGWEEFRDQCRRQMQRPLESRMRYGFCRVYRPVLDDAPWRVFDTMAEYREWCAANLPDYLGFKPAP